LYKNKHTLMTDPPAIYTLYIAISSAFCQISY